MEEIFKQYGTPIIIVSVIVALIVIFTKLLSANDGMIMTQFQSLLAEFFKEAKFSGASGAIIGGLLG